MMRFIGRLIPAAAVLLTLAAGLSGSQAAANTARVRITDPKRLAHEKALLQAYVLVNEMLRFRSFYGHAPASFDQLVSAQLAFLNPYNAVKKRPARVNATGKGLEDGDFVLQGGFGESAVRGRKAYFVGVVEDGKVKALVNESDRTGDAVKTAVGRLGRRGARGPKAPPLVQGQTLGVRPARGTRISRRAEYLIWAAQQTARDAVYLYTYFVGDLEKWDELAEWGIRPFNRIGSNAITNGPLLVDDSPGNVCVKRLPSGSWSVRGIGKDGKPIEIG
jgi:hypothetical protein